MFAATDARRNSHVPTVCIPSTVWHSKIATWGIVDALNKAQGPISAHPNSITCSEFLWIMGVADAHGCVGQGGYQSFQRRRVGLYAQASTRELGCDPVLSKQFYGNGMVISWLSTVFRVKHLSQRQADRGVSAERDGTPAPDDRWPQRLAPSHRVDLPNAQRRSASDPIAFAAVSVLRHLHHERFASAAPRIARRWRSRTPGRAIS